MLVSALLQEVHWSYSAPNTHLKNTFLAATIQAICTYIFQQSQSEFYHISTNIISSNHQKYIYCRYGSLQYLQKSNPVPECLEVHIRTETKNTLDVRIFDVEKLNFQIPSHMAPFDVYRDIEDPPKTDIDSEFEVVVTQPKLGIRIQRRSTGEAIFDSTGSTLAQSKNYVEFSTKTATKFLFGLGQRNSRHLRLRKGVQTLFAKDMPVKVENRKGGNNVYSSHPMQLMREKSNNFHVFFFKNSNPMDAIHGTSTLTFKTTGGVIHFKLLLGDKNPESAIRLYHDYLGGGWLVPPFWSMGFHQSRWGQDTVHKQMSVAETFKVQDLPMDAIWSDIDYMRGHQVFTVNTDRFPKQLILNMQSGQAIKWIPIVDLAVGLGRVNDSASSLGQEMDIFCRSPTTGLTLLGQVWAGYSVFPDQFHPNALTQRQTLLSQLFNETNQSGIWLDMNEPANPDCTGECPQKEDILMPQEEPQMDRINSHIEFPQIPGEVDLAHKSLPPHMLHYGDYLHKDVHNLYGFLDMQFTHRTLTHKLGHELPFIISRSTFPGSQRQGFNWLGDNGASFEHMQISIPSIVLFNFFGTVQTGSDICGQMHNTQKNLCARWVQLGALYPFSRNHNILEANSQEFYMLDEPVPFTASKNLKLRQSILKHYYSLFLRTQQKGTIMRPLFFEFADDEQCQSDPVMDRQFMLGSELMATPVLTQGVTQTEAQFPQGGWNHFVTGMRIQACWDEPQVRTVNNTINDQVPLWIRAGHIVARQAVQKVLRSMDLDNQFTITAALTASSQQHARSNINMYASGSMINLQNLNNDKQVKESCIDGDECIASLGIVLQCQLGVCQVVLQARASKPLQNLIINRILLQNTPIIDVEKAVCTQGDSNQKCALVMLKFNYVWSIDNISFNLNSNKNLKIQLAWPSQ